MLGKPLCFTRTALPRLCRDCSPHLCRNALTPSHICTGAWARRCHICTPLPHLHGGLGSPLPHLHAAATSARGTGLAAATSARGAGLSSQSKVLDTPPRTLAHPPHILHTPDRRRLPAPDKPANHYSLVWGSKFKRRLARQHRNDGSGCRGYSFACCCSSSTLREAWRGSRTAFRANCPAASQIGPKAKVESDVAAEI